ncbi:putative pectinesterase inhibitor domain-containing protein [Arabidopsis thaliana]
MKFLIHLSGGFSYSKSCKENTRYAEPYIYKFCITSIKENPESQKVRNIDELTVVCTNSAISNLTKVKGTVENILNERKYKNKLSHTFLRECLKLYSEGYELLNSALKYLKTLDYEKFIGNMDMAKGKPRACEMKKENDVLFDMINIPYYFCFNAHING